MDESDTQPDELDAQVVIDILRNDLERVRWENVLLRAKVAQMTENRPVG